MICHPQGTQKIGWKLVENCTQHVIFNEGIIFGETLDSFDQKKINSYWASQNSLLVEEIQNFPSDLDLQNSQISDKFEGELSSSSINLKGQSSLATPKHQSSKNHAGAPVPPPPAPVKYSGI